MRASNAFSREQHSNNDWWELVLSLGPLATWTGRSLGVLYTGSQRPLSSIWLQYSLTARTGILFDCPPVRNPVSHPSPTFPSSLWTTLNSAVVSGSVLGGTQTKTGVSSTFRSAYTFTVILYLTNTRWEKFYIRKEAPSNFPPRTQLVRGRTWEETNPVSFPSVSLCWTFQDKDIKMTLWAWESFLLCYVSTSF